MARIATYDASLQVRVSLSPIHRRLYGAALAACVLSLAATAVGSANPLRDSAIVPGTHVNGMRVVIGRPGGADATIFGTVCDPVVRPGRRVRVCGRLPSLRRIFVGYGISAPEQEIVREWKALVWEMWIDGQQVSLRRFGHADRWLPTPDPGVAQSTVWREWSITLVGAEGRHSIRYRIRGRPGITDTTWRFTVA